MSPGQEAEPLAGLDRGPGEDDPLDLALGQRRGGHRHREEGLAGAGRADPEGDRVAADRVDVAFLVQRLRRDLGVAVAPDDVVEDLRRALVGVERAGHRLDRPRRDVVALLDQLDQLVDDGRRLLHVAGVAVEGEDVAAQVEVARRSRPRSARRTVSSEPASSAATVLSSVSCLRAKLGPSFSRTAALTRLPSARPPTFGISADITSPICFCSVAPVSATAASTSAASSSSESCCGQVALDQLRLEALGGGLLGPPGAVVGLGRLDPLLALALQHRDLVALAQLGVLLERRRRPSAAPRRARGRALSSPSGRRPEPARERSSR